MFALIAIYELNYDAKSNFHSLSKESLFEDAIFVVKCEKFAVDYSGIFICSVNFKHLTVKLTFFMMKTNIF